jgi:uncharacterized membrane protein YccC
MRRARQGPLKRRQPSRLSRWHVQFSPEAASLSEGLRAAAACASLAAVAVIGRDPNLAWAAVMAFWTCLVDPGGPTRIRARILFTYTVGATFVAVLCAGVASFGEAPAAVALLAITLICSFLRVYGAEAAILSNLLVVAAVVTIARPEGDPVALLGFAGLCLVGCLWASLLSLTVWRIHPYGAARSALGLAYRRLAAMAVGLAGTQEDAADEHTWAAYAQHHRGAVRQAIEDARNRILQATGGRNDQDNVSVAGARLLSGLAAAETQFACLIALSDVLERRGPGAMADRRRSQRLAMRIASVMHRLDRAVSAVDGAPEPLRLAARRLAQTAEAAPANVGRLIAPITAEAMHIADDDLDVDFGAAVPSGLVRQKPLAPLLKNLTWNSIFLRHSARVAVSVTGAYLLAESFHLPYGYWMTTTVALIQQPYLSSSWVRALERVTGSVLGGGLAAVLGMAFHSQLALLVLMFPLAMACMAFRAVNYSLYIFFLTPLFVLILDLTHPGVREASIAGIRAMDAVIGGAVGLAGSLLLWPGSEGDRLKLALADAVDRAGKLAKTALSSPGEDVKPIRAARREAGLASNKADEARRRAGLEMWWRRKELEAVDAALAAVRRVGGASVALWLEGHPTHDPAADLTTGQWAAQTTDLAAGALRQGGLLSDPPAAPAAHHAQPIVEAVLGLFAAVRPLTTAPRDGG